MKLFFIDETGRQGSGGKDKFFFLCGLIVDSNSLIKLNTDLNQIAQNKSITNFKDIRSGVSNNKSASVHKEIAEALKKAGNKNVIRSIIFGESTLRNSQSKTENYTGALSFLIERFYLQLKQDNEVGLMFFDSCDKKLESNIKRWFYKFVSTEENKMNLKRNGFYRERIYPELIFCNDRYNLVLQITDVIASCLNYAVTKSFKESKSIDIQNLNRKSKYLQEYWPLFARSSFGEVGGWGIKFW